jgi:glyoxylase-like metal-dependent hydrolase (beta-lactamase superfamily II)
VLFSGDTLFRGSIGRTDFPYSDNRAMLVSLKEHILPMDDNVAVYPGHGASSTIGWEKKHNFFLSADRV